jgi:AN1-type zinc finger and ubiquitin domain-containing protein 1
MSDLSGNSVPKRCTLEGCRCKIKLTDFPCRCGKYFCSQHRVAESHMCSYDYKQSHKDFLLKTMSTAVVAQKVGVI